VVAPFVRLPLLGAAVLFFGNVNQVLVRLWTRGHDSGRLAVLGRQNAFLTPETCQLNTASMARRSVVCLTGNAVRENGAPTVGRRGFRGVVNDGIGWILSAIAQAIDGAASRQKSLCCGVDISRTVISRFSVAVKVVADN
jgi:hypothetical protein